MFLIFKKQHVSASSGHHQVFSQILMFWEKTWWWPLLTETCSFLNIKNITSKLYIRVQLCFWLHTLLYVNTCFFFERERERERERPFRCVLSNLYNILCTVNTQHTRQDAIITIRLYLAICFGRRRPFSGQLRTTLRYSKNSTQWNPIAFTLKCLRPKHVAKGKGKAIPLQAWSGP